METRHLPVIQDLYDGDLEMKKDQNEFNVLVNQPPAKAWLKEHPFAKGVRYIPVERVEWLMTRIFFRWHLEIKQVQIMANSVVITVRLHYQDIHSDNMLWQDGIGAVPIQTDRGAGAMDWNKTKSDAVMKAAPAAESYAFKDAAEKIGKLFGKDLNRKDEVGYNMLLDTMETAKQKEKQLSEIFEDNEPK